MKPSPLRPARAYPAAYYVECPSCGEGVLCPQTGSYLIGRDSVDAWAKAHGKGKGECQCGYAFKLPAAVAKLGA